MSTTIICDTPHPLNGAANNANYNKVIQPELLDGTPALRNILESQSFASFVCNDIDAVMFDCDGVLWLESYVFPSAPELIKLLRCMGKKVFFMTNNSTKTRPEFVEKFNKLGFDVTMDEIVSTSYMAALYLKEIGFNKKVYVVGTEGVTNELKSVGIESLPVGPDVLPGTPAWGHSLLNHTELSKDVGAVIVGFDHHFSYVKLYKAASYLKDPNCIFIATNTDESFPAANNRTIPGTGSIVSSVKTAAQREPIIMGKPSCKPFDIVKRSHSLQAKRVLMVGDRGNTDILFGNNCGMHTLLVLTGVTNLEEARQWTESDDDVLRKCVPEFYATSVAELYDLLQANLQFTNH